MLRLPKPPLTKRLGGRGVVKRDFDEDKMGNGLSLAAIEADLKPKLVQTFDSVSVADTW